MGRPARRLLGRNGDGLIKLDVYADYNSLEQLATRLVERINDYTEELKEYDENDLDGFWHYLSGCISAYQSVASMIGVPIDLIYPEENA